MSGLILKADLKISDNEKSILNTELTNVREEFIENPYIVEAVKVLSVGGYRSAIGNYWNAVVDDLRRKIAHRSLDLFNKEMNLKRQIKTYEDFQDHVTDMELIEGAFKIGVIGWEAKKLLNHARETRHIFDGHPSSSNPNIAKVLNMISDCNKYVLSQEYMPEIIDIDSYMANMDGENFSKNQIAIEQAFSDLPEIYQDELINKFYGAFIHDSSSSELRANIEFCAPILWGFLPKEKRLQIGRRLDKDFVNGDKTKIEKGIDFLILVKGLRYVSVATRRSIYEPAVTKLTNSIGDWSSEATAIRNLRKLGTTIPDDLIKQYVSSLTLIYVGTKGYSSRYGRTDFYSDTAAPIVKTLFEKFDNRTAAVFVEIIKTDKELHDRIKYPEKLNRLRDLGNVLLDNLNLSTDEEDFLDLLVDKNKEVDFLKILKIRR